MGEAKRRREAGEMPSKTPIEDVWKSYDAMVIPAAAGELQRQECKMAFFAGCTALFTAITWGMDPGEDPTAADMRRMDTINAELRAFGAQFDKQVLDDLLARAKPAGRA